MAEFNLGDIVSVTNEGTIGKKIGKITDPRGESHYRWPTGASHQDRIPVVFHKSTMPRWFYAYQCCHLTETQRKTYFKDLLRGE